MFTPNRTNVKKVIIFSSSDDDSPPCRTLSKSCESSLSCESQKENRSAGINTKVSRKDSYQKSTSGNYACLGINKKSVSSIKHADDICFKESFEQTSDGKDQIHKVNELSLPVVETNQENSLTKSNQQSSTLIPIINLPLEVTKSAGHDSDSSSFKKCFEQTGYDGDQTDEASEVSSATEDSDHEESEKINKRCMEQFISSTHVPVISLPLEVTTLMDHNTDASQTSMGSPHLNWKTLLDCGSHTDGKMSGFQESAVSVTDDINEQCLKMMQTLSISSTPSSRPTISKTPYSCASSTRKLRSVDLSSDEDEEYSTARKLFSESSETKVKKKETLFLESLSTSIVESDADPEALRYRKNFHGHKYELAKKLFSLFNEKVFANKLPEDTNIVWNGHFLSTAGQCAYKRTAHGNFVTISLALKVLNSADQLRDTLLHEMCHAAVFMNHNVNGKHGPLWQAYATRCALVFPELKIPQRCHSYDIRYRCHYHCQKCSAVIKRQYDRLDTTKHRCRCGGKLVLFRK